MRVFSHRGACLLGALVLLGLATFAQNSAAIPAVPGASGFGIETVAGRNGKVYKVTNLKSSGEGSLKDCIERSGPRVCVFEVSGTIKLKSNLRIKNPYLTVAGQTAPSPGVSLRGAGLTVLTHDVLVQHIRVRVGDAPSGPDYENRDGIQIDGHAGKVHNVVMDHVSVSWAVDENVSLWHPGVRDITFRNSIISEALYDSKHPKGPHSMGLIVGPGVEQVSIIGNLFAHNGERNFRGQGNGVVFANNVVYNRKTKGVDIGEGSGASRYCVVGNVFIRGKDGGKGKPIDVRKNLAAGARIYMSDNVAEESNGNPWSVVPQPSASYRASAVPIWPKGLLAMDSAEVEAYVLANAGARPADRDAVDRRIVANVKDRTGRLIDSQEEVGGWPDLGRNYRALTLPKNPGADQDGDGYTDLEEWLDGFAAEVEGRARRPLPPRGLGMAVP